MTPRTIIAAAVALAAAFAFADPATGWKQTAAGTYRYADAANWVDGEVNGVFGSDLALAGDQTIQFDADASIDGMTIAFTGARTLAFASDGAARTLALGGTISVNVADGAKVSFGAADDTLALDFGSGGVRFAIERGNVDLGGKISGSGGFSAIGGNLYNSVLQVLNGANDFTGTVTIGGGARACHVCFASAGAFPASGATVRIADGGVLRTSAAAGYSAAWWIASGFIESDSSGTLGIGGNENGSLDFTGYPYLALGSSGDNYTFSGTLTPADGLYRIRTAGKHFYLSNWNVLTGVNDVIVENQTASESVYIQAGNDLTGTIRVRKGGFILHGANGAVAAADIVMEESSQLILQDSKNSGKTVANSVTLKGATFSIGGNAANDVEHVITGALRVDGTSGTCSFVRMTSNNSKAVVLRAARLEMPVPAVLGVDGAGLGATPGANACNIVFGEAPALIGGGGAAGTTTVSIVPRIMGSDTANGSNPANYIQSFVTYDATTGLRPLNLSTEYESTIPTTSPYANVRLPFGSTVELSAPAVVNSLLFQGAASGTPVEQLKAAADAQNAKVTVSSGQVLLGQRKGGSGTYFCSVPIDFGAETGMIWHEHDKTQYLQAPLSGSGGLVYAQAATSVTSEKATQLMGDSSGLSGDVWVIGEGMFGSDFLSGLAGRDGVVYVPLHSRLLHNLNTTVSGYRLHIDGEVTKAAITAAAGGTLSGCGKFDRLVTLQGGAKVEAGSALVGTEDASLDFAGGLSVSGAAALELQNLGGGSLGSATVGGTFTMGGSGKLTVSVSDADWSGQHVVIASAGAMSRGWFGRGDGCGAISLREAGRELWMEPPKGLLLLFR